MVIGSEFGYGFVFDVQGYWGIIYRNEKSTKKKKKKHRYLHKPLIYKSHIVILYKHVSLLLFESSEDEGFVVTSRVIQINKNVPLSTYREYC